MITFVRSDLIIRPSWRNSLSSADVDSSKGVLNQPYLNNVENENYPPSINGKDFDARKLVLGSRYFVGS
jgi:hypothetical protein